MYKVYKVTNLINYKSYIGLTRRSLKARRSDHYHKVKENSQYKFHIALRQFKKENFKWEILFQTNDIEEANKKEKEMIKFYDSLNSGYNSTEGGDSFERQKNIIKKEYKYDTNINNIKNMTINEQIPNFENYIKFKIKDYGQRIFSKNFGISETIISNFINNRRRISLEKLIQYSDFLKINPDDFFQK